MASKRSFEAVVRAGHKQCAVAIPFDPVAELGSAAERIRPGRRGHAVAGTVNGHPFRSHLVSRQRTWFLLLEEEVLAGAKAGVGDAVKVVLQSA
jgi:hypothetical protein